MPVNWTEVAKTSPTVLLSILVIGCTFSIEAWGMFHGFSTAIDDVVLGRILGTLDTSSGIVLAYWFGSTRSSHDKDTVIASQLNPQSAKETPP